MNLRIITLFCTLLFVFACSEKSKKKAEQKEASALVITNAKKGNKHVNIPNSRLFIIPPKGFQVSGSLPGLKSENASIQVMDLIGGNFESNTRSFSKEAFQNAGVEVLEYKKLKVGDYPAILVVIQGENNLKSIQLVFGDDTFSTVVMGYISPTDTENEKAIKKALETIYYDLDFKTNPVTTAKFTVDENISRFKYAKNMSSIMFYTLDGVDKKSYKNEPMVMISTFPIDSEMTLRSTAEMIISGLEEKGLKVSEIKNKSSKVVDDIRMYEVDVYGSMKGNDAIIYILVAVGYDAVITLQGLVRSSSKKDLAEVKKFASSLRLK